MQNVALLLFFSFQMLLRNHLHILRHCPKSSSAIKNSLHMNQPAVGKIDLTITALREHQAVAYVSWLLI